MSITHSATDRDAGYLAYTRVRDKINNIEENAKKIAPPAIISMEYLGMTVGSSSMSDSGIWMEKNTIQSSENTERLNTVTP